MSLWQSDILQNCKNKNVIKHLSPKCLSVSKTVPKTCYVVSTLYNRSVNIGIAHTFLVDLSIRSAQAEFPY
jgi:hypothetical protein